MKYRSEYNGRHSEVTHKLLMAAGGRSAILLSDLRICDIGMWCVRYMFFMINTCREGIPEIKQYENNCIL